MAITFHVANFKNKTLDMLTGVTATATPIYYVNPYNGAQVADPSIAPAGAYEFAAATSGPNLNTSMSAAGGGISQLARKVPPTTPANALSTASITTCRLYTSASLPLIDVVASTVGGGGEIILDSLTAAAGIGSRVDAFSLKLPFNNGGTLSMSASLVNRMIDLWCGGASVVPEMGKNTNGACALYIYSGAAPATADTDATGSLLATISLGSTNAWNAASGGACSLAASLSATASGTGTAGYARLVKTYGAIQYTIQGSVGTAGTDFTIDTTSLTSGVTSVSLTEATITL